MTEFWQYTGRPLEEEITQRKEFRDRVGKDHLATSRACPSCGSGNTERIRQGWSICFSCIASFVSAHEASGLVGDDIVPLPLGKIIPDLRGSYNYNKDSDYYEINWLADIFFGHLEDILCPNCDSSNVCCINPVFNPDIGRRWFCISCYDSWKYGYDH